MSEAFIEKLQTLLLERNIPSIIELINNDESTPKFRENPWETIPAITKNLNENVKKQDPQFFETCKNILEIITQKLQPDDVLLIIIKDVESAADDLMFVTLLQPLQRAVLQLLPKNRVNYLAWCFNSVQTYINELPLPENLNLEGQEKLLMDADGAVSRISSLYSEFLPFYNPIIQEILKLNSQHELKTLTTKFLLQLLSKPLAYLDMECENKPKSKGRRVGEDLASKIISLCPDVYRFLDADYNNETDDIKVNNLAFGVFFYLLLSEQVNLEKCPKVYDSVYVFQGCLKFAVELFNHENQFVTEKAIRLSTALLSMVRGNKLSYHLLDSDVHCKFCKGLTNIMIYSPVEAYRKSTLEVFRTYLYHFDTRGRYLLIYNITSNFHYTALTSYLITQYKEMLVEEFDKNEFVSEYFCGTKLLDLLNMFCKLPEGAESDLMKLADQIIASINLLRYLAIRDKQNVTKIWGHFGSLEKNYLEPLLKALMLSKAHYNLKVKEVLTENAHGDRGESKSKVSVTIGGHNLPELSTTEKLQVLNSSITAFDVMESLLCRLNECIQNSAAVWVSTRQHLPHFSTESNPESDKYEEDIKNKILKASLPFVSKLGWSKEALASGAEQVGYPGIIHGMFTRGGGDLVNYFQKTSNEELVNYMKNQNESEVRIAPVDFVEDAVKIRLQMIIPYLSKWPQAIAIMALPPNMPTALASQLTLVDDICYYAGDRSVDFSWYARRIALAAIYKATELYMLQDKSLDFTNSWRFLNNRLTEAVQLQDLLISSETPGKRSSDALAAAFITARNILGMNNR